MPPDGSPADPWLRGRCSSPSTCPMAAAARLAPGLRNEGAPSRTAALRAAKVESIGVLPPAPIGPRAVPLRGEGPRPFPSPPRVAPHLKQLPRDAKLGPKRHEGQSQSPSRRPRRPPAASPPPRRPPPPPLQAPPPICPPCCPLPRLPPLPPPAMVAKPLPPPSAPPPWPPWKMSWRMRPSRAASSPAPSPRGSVRRCGMGERPQAGPLCAEWWLCRSTRASATRSRALACPRARRARRCQAGSPRALVARTGERSEASRS